MKNLNQYRLKAFLIMCLFIVGCNHLSMAQQNYLSKSNAQLSTLQNTIVDASSILTEGRNIVVFWKSYNDDHATYIQEVIDATQDSSNVKIIAICNDNQGTFKHINPMVSKRNWEIDVYIDKERTLNQFVNSKQSLLTLVFENKKLVKQFYGNKDEVNPSFFNSRYGSIILN